MIENVRAVVGYEEVFETVVIVVAGTDSLPPSGLDQAGLLSDIDKSPIALIAIKVISGRGAARRTHSGSIHQKDIEQAVVVIVEESDPAARALKDVALSLVSAVDVHCRQAGTSRDVFEMNGGPFSRDQASTVSWRRVSARQQPGRQRKQDRSRSPCRDAQGARAFKPPHQIDRGLETVITLGTRRLRAAVCRTLRCPLGARASPPRTN